MRLSKQERGAIREAAHAIFGVPVYLFGSRVDDSRRGGDIDLYLEVGLPPEEIAQRRLQFIARLYRDIGERKIDVVINDGRGRLPIYEVARRQGVPV